MGPVLGLLLALSTGCATHPPASPPSKAGQAAMTPGQALDRLKSGNARFVAGATARRDWSTERARTAAGQYPFAIVLSCIDSRVSPELIFDQGLGEIFGARVAGNVVTDDILGSAEFACQAAGARLIAVIGHSRCGAIKGASAGVQLGHLTGLLERIQPSVAEARTRLPGVPPTDERFVALVAELNVRRVLEQIRGQSPVLRELIDSGRVGLVGGIHDLESGTVHFFNP